MPSNTLPNCLTRLIDCSSYRQLIRGIGACSHDVSRLVLLDDPLSAVDAAVAQTLFEDCICGTMKGASRVLVTHQRQFLPKCDRIVVVDEGRIVATGTYEEIKLSGSLSMDGLFHLETPEEVEGAKDTTAGPLKESIVEKPVARGLPPI